MQMLNWHKGRSLHSEWQLTSQNNTCHVLFLLFTKKNIQKNMYKNTKED